MGKLEDGFVGGIAGKGFAQERDIVTELFEQVAIYAAKSKRVQCGEPNQFAVLLIFLFYFFRLPVRTPARSRD